MKDIILTSTIGQGKYQGVIYKFMTLVYPGTAYMYKVSECKGGSHSITPAIFVTKTNRGFNKATGTPIAFRQYITNAWKRGRVLFGRNIRRAA